MPWDGIAAASRAANLGNSRVPVLAYPRPGARRCATQQPGEVLLRGRAASSARRHSTDAMMKTTCGHFRTKPVPSLAFSTAAPIHRPHPFASSSSSSSDHTFGVPWSVDARVRLELRSCASAVSRNARRAEDRLMAEGASATAPGRPTPAAAPAARTTALRSARPARSGGPTRASAAAPPRALSRAFRSASRRRATPRDASAPSTRRGRLDVGLSASTYRRSGVGRDGRLTFGGRRWRHF